jgi:hypothetical protein
MSKNFIVTAAIILFFTLSNYAQTLPMDRWLDKVELKMNDIEKGFHFEYWDAFKGCEVGFNLWDFKIKNKVLCLGLTIKKTDPKTNKKSFCPIDDFPPFQVKIVSQRFINEMLSVHIYVGGLKWRPSIQEVNKVIVVCQKEIDPKNVNDLSKTIQWKTYEFTTYTCGDVSYGDCTRGMIGVDIKTGPNVIDSIPSYE